MATGTVSAATPNQWQLISSVTPTAGATAVTFSSVAGYKTLMLVAQGVTQAGEIAYTRFNGDATAGNYYGTYNGVPLGSLSSTAAGRMLIVYDVNQSVAHRVDSVVNSTAGTLGLYHWYNPTPITSISFELIGGGTFTAVGTVYLYGIAA